MKTVAMNNIKTNKLEMDMLNFTQNEFQVETSQTKELRVEQLRTLLNKITSRDKTKLEAYLIEESDFLTAPASCFFHNNFEGGLFDHSVNVYTYAKQFAKVVEASHQIIYTDETLLLTTLCHDLCKCNQYETGIRWTKDDKTGKWQSYQTYLINDQFPLGHGEKSVFMLQKLIDITEEEACSIRWHLGFSDPSIHTGWPSRGSFQQAFNNYPLVKIVHLADLSTALNEKCYDHKKGEYKK